MAKKTSDYETVNHPPHYNKHPSGVECIDIIEHMPYNIGAAIKYLWRVGLKPGSPPGDDLRKAIWYIEREIKRLNDVNSNLATEEDLIKIFDDYMNRWYFIKDRR